MNFDFEEWQMKFDEWWKTVDAHFWARKHPKVVARRAWEEGYQQCKEDHDIMTEDEYLQAEAAAQRAERGEE